MKSMPLGLLVWLVAIVLVAVPAGAYSANGKLAIIGDSISLATHANDDCGPLDVYQCMGERLGQPDPEYSFAGGTKIWSVLRQLDLDGVVDASMNGARWRDAPSQAREVLQDSDVRAVVVHLGSNDVCRPLGRSQPPLANIETSVDETLTLLTDSLPAGTVVYLSELVDIVQLRDAMAELDHNPVFESCQALWDLDFSRVKSSAVAETCEHFFGRACSGSVTSFLLEQSHAALTLLFEGLDEASLLGVEGSCGSVLNSESTEDDRNDARRFNIALNDLMKLKANEFAGRKGVQVSFLGGLFEEAIATDDVSALDCFHPSRAGQWHIADVLGLSIVPRRRSIHVLPGVELLLRHKESQD